MLHWQQNSLAFLLYLHESNLLVIGGAENSMRLKVHHTFIHDYA